MSPDVPPGEATDSYAARRRLGLLVIPAEIVAPQETQRLLPESPIMSQHRVEFEEVDTPRNRVRALSAMTEAVRVLGQAKPEIIGFGCTSGGAFAGAGWHADLLHSIRPQVPSIPFYTAAEAVTEVLGQLGIGRIALGTPYSEETIDGVIDVLAAKNIEVIASSMLFPQGYPDPWTVMSTPSDVVARFAIEADHVDADAVFISCTGLPSTAVLAEVEEQIGKPLLTSTVALTRVFRQFLGYGPLEGYGSVLSSIDRG